MNRYQEALDGLKFSIDFYHKQSNTILNCEDTKFKILQELIDQSKIKDKHINQLEERLRLLNCEIPPINPCEGCKDYCYKNDDCKSNGGCGNKSARELFKEAGFEYEDCIEGKIIYFNENTEVQIEFNLEEKTYEVFELFKYSVGMKLHKLINYQLEELGWL